MNAAENMARFLKALYPLGLMLALIPLIDWMTRVYPFFPGQVQWRFGAEVALVATLGIVLTGLGLLGGIAVYCGHRVALRVLAGIAATGAVLAVVLLGMFLLDASQMRSGMTDANLRAGLTKALISGSVTALMGGIVLASMAWGLWRAAPTQEPRREVPSSVLVRRRGAAPSGGTPGATPPPA